MGAGKIKLPVLWILSIFLTSAAEECADCDSPQPKSGVAMLVKAHASSGFSVAKESVPDGADHEAKLINKLLTNPAAEFSESMVQELAEMKITPAVKGFINGTLTAVGSVFTAITDASNTDKQSRQTEYDAFKPIEDAFAAKKAECANYASTANFTREEHYHCRAVEEKKCYDDLTECRRVEAIIKGDLDICLTRVTQKTICFPDLFCTAPAAGDGVPGTDPEITAKVEEKIQCTEAYPADAREYIRIRSLYMAKVKECGILQGTYDAKVPECCTKQGTFESDMCSLNDCMNAGCSTYQSAYRIRHDDYVAVDTNVVKNGKKRLFEWTHLKRCMCTLEKLLSHDLPNHEQLAKEITACGSTPYVNPDLDIASVPPPPESGCDTIPPMPCVDTFTGPQYTDRLPVETPPCACKACL